jgi:hypothetical protein
MMILITLPKIRCQNFHSNLRIFKVSNQLLKSWVVFVWIGRCTQKKNSMELYHSVIQTIYCQKKFCSIAKKINNFLKSSIRRKEFFQRLSTHKLLNISGWKISNKTKVSVKIDMIIDEAYGISNSWYTVLYQIMPTPINVHFLFTFEMSN